MSVKFLVGDICTYNRFECRVESVDESAHPGKVKIAFAVFIDGDGKQTYDENDTKLVPPNRLKLVRRVWNESLLKSVAALESMSPQTPKSARKSMHASFTPSFSARQRNARSNDSPIDDKENRDSGLANVRVSETKLKKPRIATRKKRSPKKPRQPRRSISHSSDDVIPIVPDSYSESSPGRKARRRSKAYSESSGSSSSDSSDSSSSDYSSLSGSSVGVNPRRKSRAGRGSRPDPKPRIKRASMRVSLDDSPIPIVPDSFTSEEYDLDSQPNSAVISLASDSQESDHMRSLALAYEERARKADRSSWTREVEFDWDPRKGRVKLVTGLPKQRDLSTGSSFIVQDTPPIADIVHRNTVASLWKRFENPDKKNLDTIKEMWKYIDELYAPLDKVDEIFSFVRHLTSSVEFTSNIAAETRMAFTQTGFACTSVPGWIASVATVALFTARFKKQLFADFMGKLADKCSTRFDIKTCYIIALLLVVKHDATAGASLDGDPLVNTLICKTIVSTYTAQNTEGQDLIELLITTIISANPLPFAVNELLSILAGVLGSFSPAPMDVTESLTYKLSSSFACRLITYIGSCLPNPSYLPMLVKGGGFLPMKDIGQQRIDFSKHRGLSFYNVIKDKGFCDWSERIPDPSSVSFVDWLDFVLWTRQVCIIGARSVRADVELVRLAGDHSTVQLWARNRALVALRSIDFFDSIPQKHLVKDHVAYAQCMYEVLRRICDDSSLSPLTEIQRPRGEIVKELFRPLLKLGSVVTTIPGFKERVVDSIIAVRAETYNCSMEEAKSELISIHSLSFS